MPKVDHRPVGTQHGRREHGTSVIAARRSLGEVLYAVRMPDACIKLGWTADLGERMQRLGGPRIELLGFMPGTRADELALHRRLRPYRARGREYYNASPAVFDVVNEMRELFNLPPLTA